MGKASQLGELDVRFSPNTSSLCILSDNSLALTSNDAKATDAYNIGVQHHMEGRLQLALDGYRECVQIAPNYPDVYNNIATVYRAANHDIQAAYFMRIGVNLQPNDGLMAMQLGFLEQSLVMRRHRRSTANALRELVNKGFSSKPRSVEASSHPFISGGIIPKTLSRVPRDPSWYSA